MTVGAWVHAAYVYDGNKARIFVDGILKDSVTYTGTKVSVTNGQLWIGKYGPSGASMPGLLDEVRIYSRILTPSEITTLAADR